MRDQQRRRASVIPLTERSRRTLPAHMYSQRASSLRRRHDVLLKELRLAEEVQRCMLPRVLPKLPEVEFGASLRPSLHLAGDFYNVIRLDRDRVGICVGDVMGHGPAAALLGVFAMQALRTKTIDGSSYEVLEPSEVLSNLSRELRLADFPDSPFVTMLYAVLDTARSTFTYCSGGHPPAILLRPDEMPTKLEGRSSVLGVFDLPFEQDEITLRPGDRLAIYSDGADMMFWGDYGPGMDGLARLLAERDDRSPQELIDTAMLVAQCGDGPMDDLTLFMLEMKP